MRTRALSRGRQARTPLLTAALLASTALASPVLAQSAPAADEAEVAEIVVTAQRREQSLNDVGMSIQAFGAEQLEEMRVTNVQDLSTAVPSFTVARSYQGVPTFTLRGIGFNTINMSATSTVGTYVDEVAYAYPMMLSGPVFDLERVEVLKGPQGTLYGRNTTAGLINFVTQKPSTEFEARAVAEVGNYETMNFEGMVSGPITENLQGRLSFRSEKSGRGWQVSQSRGERLGEVDRIGVRGALAFQPTDALSIDASINYWVNKSDTLAAQAIGFTPGTTPQGVNPLGAGFWNAPGLANFIATSLPTSGEQADWAPDARRTSTVGTTPGIDKPLEEDSSFLGAKLNVAWDISDDLTLVSLTSFNKIERKGVMDWAGAPYNVLVQDADGEIESFAQELRIQGGNDRVTWLVGGYYGQDDIVDTNQTLFRDNANVRLFQFLSGQLLATPFNTGPLPGGAGPGGVYTAAQAANTFQTYRDDGRIETTTASLFASADWTLTDSLTLTTGLRYTQDKQDANICSRDVNGSMLTNLNLTNKYLYLLRYGVAITDNVVANGCSTTRINRTTMTATRGEVITNLEEDNIAWRVALNWNVTDDVLLFGSVSQGAKSGGAPVNTASLYEQNLPAQQEQLLAYEVGVKAALFERRLQANVAAFYYDYTDKQMSTFNPDALYTALARLQNIPESFAYGVDAELTMRPSENFTLITAATFLHTEIDGFVGTNGAGLPQDYDGAPFLYSPKFLGSITALYNRDLTDNLGFKAMLNGRYQATSQADLEGSALYEIPAYGVWNASVGVESLDGRWGLSAWARNLTDTYYWTAVASNANTVVRFPGQTRTVGVTLTINY